MGAGRNYSEPQGRNLNRLGPRRPNSGKSFALPEHALSTRSGKRLKSWHATTRTSANGRRASVSRIPPTRSVFAITLASIQSQISK